MDCISYVAKAKALICAFDFAYQKGDVFHDAGPIY